MPVLLNPRHEKFARLLAEGRTEYEAYELCHYKPNKGNPHKLASNPLVAARVMEITTEAAKRTVVNKEYLIERALSLLNTSEKVGQMSSAVSALREMGVLSGVRVERTEIGAPGEFEALADDELERILVERMAELGLPEGETQH